jgi:tetratricopeptide (TPR) repeat protein
MGDRETLLNFLKVRYDADGLRRLADEIGIDSFSSPLPLDDLASRLMQEAERNGLAAALIMSIERAFPFQMPLLEWAGVRAGHENPLQLPPAPQLHEVPPHLLAHASAPPPAPEDDEEPNATRNLPVLGMNEGRAIERGAEAGACTVAEVHAPAPEGKPYRFVHGYTLPTHWAKREKEISELIAEIRANRYSILSLIAIGGTGKSALTRKLLDELPLHRVPLDGALWFSFYVEPDFDRFLTEACRYLIPAFDPKEHPSPYEKGVLLREAMNTGHYLLVLDGIEVLLVSERNRKDFATFRDRALKEFLEGLGDGTRSQVLISTRFPLADLEGKEFYRPLQLADLTLEAADELISSYGVQGDWEQRAQMYARFGSHALTLQVLGDFLIRYHEGDPAGLQEILSFPSNAPQGIKLQAALDSYWQHLQPEERFFLTRMSAFRGGVDERSVIVLNRSGDNYSPEFRAMVRRLLATPLVSVERREGHTRLTAHPLIKTFFYDRMGDLERQQTHRALKDYAQGLPVPDKPRTLEDYEPLLEACHHCLQIGLFTEAYQMYRRNGMDNALRWWGHYTQALELLEALREACQGDSPSWQSERWHKSWVENETALLHLLRGDMNTAIERFQRSAEMDAKSGDVQGESASLQNLASALIQQGDYQNALALLERSRTLETTLGRFEKEDMLAGLEGICRGELGQLQVGFDLLTHAAQLSDQRGNTRAYCYWLWRAGDLCLRAKKYEASSKRHAEAWRIAEQEQFRDYMGHTLRGLGDVFRQSQDFESAHSRYTDALRQARALGNPYLENEVRLSLSRLAEAQNNLAEMQGQARQVLARAEECGYLTQCAEAHVLLARYSRAVQFETGVQQHVAEAQRLLEQSCHHATRQDLARLQEGR